MMQNKSTNTNKVMDVAPPGKTAAPATSRPIIVTNRPVLQQDPMVMPAEETPVTGDAPIVSHVAKTIAVHGTVPADKPATEPAMATGKLPTIAELAAAASKPKVAPEPAVPEPATPAPDEAPATEPSPKSPAYTSHTVELNTLDAALDEPKTEGNAADDQLAPNKVLADQKQKEEERKAAILAEQEKIIESKKYFLPVSNPEKRKANLWALVALLIALLLVLVWLDLVLDAGIVHISGVHALTHFFGPTNLP